MDDLILRLDRWDRRLHSALLVRRRPLLDRVMRMVSRVCDPPVVLLWGALLLAGLTPFPVEIARRGAAGLMLSFLLVQLVKRRIARPRPTLSIGFRALLEPPDRFSFPSGHAAAGLALVLPGILALPLLVAVPLLMAGLLVGVSRSYLGVHYPGDVLVGWWIAIGTELLLRWLS